MANYITPPAFTLPLQLNSTQCLTVDEHGLRVLPLSTWGPSKHTYDAERWYRLFLAQRQRVFDAAEFGGDGVPPEERPEIDGRKRAQGRPTR